MRTPTIPHDARHIRTYAELESYLGQFVLGHYPFLWLVGRPGVAKTESVRAAVRGRTVYHRKGGQLTPVQFYRDCYRHRGEPVILDDAEHLLDHTVGAKLVAALGDTTPAKQLSYATTAHVLGGVPDTFLTTSPLCVIANKFTAHEDIRSRAVTLYFDPTDLEVHRAAARWFWDQEVHDWFGRHLHGLRGVEARWYVIAAQDKEAGRDWRRITLAAHAPDVGSCVVQDLETDPACPTRADKARRFVELMGRATGASRASYFRLRKRLGEEGRLTVEPVPPITLSHTTRPGVPSRVELEAMGAAPLRDPELEPGPLDLPAREAFAQPVRGQPAPQAGPRRMTLDDSVGWERSPALDEEEEDE
jgi:hypothetical protein